MKFGLGLLSVLTALTATVSGQATSAYTDPATGIQFQRIDIQSNGGFHFAIAFPQNPASDSEFIGQIKGPVNTGYSAVALGGAMVGNLLLVSWAQGSTIRHSFRIAESYIEPSIYTGNAVATTMYSTVNSTTSHGLSVVRTVRHGLAAAPVLPALMPPLILLSWIAKYSSWISAAPTATSSTGPTSSPTSTTTSAVVTGTPAPATTYDYIVVGGGAGGMVAADKLSQAGKRVLLIERGPPSTWATGGRNGPSWATSNSLTRYDIPGLCNQIWIDSVGIACRDVGTMAGCVLGGGTAINAGLFFKPPAQDWDLNFPAGSGWRSTDMTAATNRVFSRIPTTDTPSQDGKRYIQESYNSCLTSLNRTYAHTPFMYINGQRGGPLATYYQTAKSRSNVKVVLNTMVDRIIRNGTHILGVELSPATNEGWSGKVMLKYGTGRVVLSAGVFGTAKILFRSELASSDGPKMIDSSDWINLPVGYNLMDHTNTDVVISHPSIVPYDFYAAWDTPIEADKTQYLNSRAGRLAGAAPAPNTMAWETIPGSVDGIARQLQWTIRVEGSRVPLFHLTTSVITPPYLKNEGDIQAVIKGLNSLMVAAKKISGVTFLFPSPTQTAEDYVRSYGGGQGANHWLGSCKMGSDDGRRSGGTSGSVVDFNTRSTVPTTFMAERAVERILALALPTMVPMYSQCGGISYTGSTWCAAGTIEPLLLQVH
ncbi:cellobiose dehydrogenase, partial [Tirmania nivea]